MRAPATANTNIRQWLVPVASSDKRNMLRDLLRTEEVTTAIIFCNRKTTVRELNKSLQRSGFRSTEIHGDMEQSQRIAELDRFKAGDVNILVASDVAARGLDIKGVSHVFNFDAPWHPDDYVHRIGRTGRAGATGTAYTFATPDDAENIDNIEKLTGLKIDRVASGRISVAHADQSEAHTPRKPERSSRSRGGRTRVDESASGQAKPAPTQADAAQAKPDPAPAMSRAERAPASRRAAKPPRTSEPRPRDHALQSANEADEGWNGPVPGFLSIGVDPV